MPENAQSSAGKLTVKIWLDMICPVCPIGERRFQKALSVFTGRDQVTIIYRSYRILPGVAPISVDEYIARRFGAHQEVSPILQQISHIAAQEGLTYRLENTLAGDTLHAHRLLHLARTVGKQKALIDSFCLGYFSGHASLFDRETLLRLSVESGIEEQSAIAVLDGVHFNDEVEADQLEAHARGIRGVPHFLIDDSVSVSGAQSAEHFLAALDSAVLACQR